jgi:uncharacterized membrane protein (DUF106 family)
MVFQTICQIHKHATLLDNIHIISNSNSFITTIIYKYATDQKRLKEIKTKLKDLRKKQKEHKKTPKKS